MVLIIDYAITLMVGVLISDLTRRSVLSTSVLFLVAGIDVSAAGVAGSEASHEIVQHVAEVVLVITVFTDAVRLR